MSNDAMPVAKKDPVPNAIPGQELVYQAIQGLWSALARRRYRDEFNRVSAFALFVGYPRSGHSVVGAMLNAHRHAVISHELDAPRLILDGCRRDELYSRILSRAAWFNLRGNTSNYRYQIRDQWQGRFETLRVIGDKGGGWAAEWLGKHPDLRRRMRDTVGVPLRLIHVVRNPFDNIAAIAQWHQLTLDQSIDFYFSHCETTTTLVDDPEVFTIRHENFIRAPVEALSALTEFLGLDAEPDYVEACSSIVFARPTESRRRAAWLPAQVSEVARRARKYPFLEGYEFEPVEEPERASAGKVKLAHPGSAFQRVAAFFNPRVRPRAGVGDV